MDEKSKFVHCYECANKGPGPYCNQFKRAIAQGSHQEMFAGCANGKRKKGG